MLKTKFAVMALSAFLSSLSYAKGTFIQCEVPNEDGTHHYLDISMFSDQYKVRLRQKEEVIELNYEPQKSLLKYLPFLRVVATAEPVGRISLELREAKVKAVSAGLPFEAVGYVTFTKDGEVRVFEEVKCEGLID